MSKRRAKTLNGYSDKTMTMTFTTADTNNFDKVEVTLTGKLKDIEKYMEHIKILEEKAAAFEEVLKAYDIATLNSRLGGDVMKIVKDYQGGFFS